MTCSSLRNRSRFILSLHFLAVSATMISGTKIEERASARTSSFFWQIFYFIRIKIEYNVDHVRKDIDAKYELRSVLPYSAHGT